MAADLKSVYRAATAEEPGQWLCALQMTEANELFVEFFLACRARNRHHEVASHVANQVLNLRLPQLLR